MELVFDISCQHPQLFYVRGSPVGAYGFFTTKYRLEWRALRKINDKNTRIRAKLPTKYKIERNRSTASAVMFENISVAMRICLTHFIKKKVAEK